MHPIMFSYLYSIGAFASPITCSASYLLSKWRALVASVVHRSGLSQSPCCPGLRIHQCGTPSMLFSIIQKLSELNLFNLATWSSATSLRSNIISHVHL